MSINPRVIELVAQWEELRAQGKSLTPEELCAKEPDLLPEVRRCIEQQERFQALADTGPSAEAAQTLAEGELPQIEGYEILGRIGHGGMGVVYKARHEKLGRVVALKVVLAGGHASAADLARFQAEARAVAQLQHPNIVQLFDSGVHNGLPFLTLELVSGGSLAERLGGTPMQPDDAAALVERLARGVHYAHQNGVVHRDLKPANVLLAPDGTPKVTDFGLAKRAEAGSSLTASGAVLGTPSYMAPEQAGGQSKHVGPLADVYALGAILYECLTGTPPFRGPTPLDTMMQVISKEPVPPTQLQPKVPRDLETICLKCLRKEPGKRYASAEALAEDLRRFQAGEPILARPVGRVERAVKWVKRRPAVAGLTGALVGVIVVAFAVVLSALFEATRARDQVEAEQKKTKEQLDKARENLFTFQLLQVAAVWETDTDEAYALLHDYNRCPIDLRDFAWGWYEGRLRRQPQRELLNLDTAGITSVAFSPDGKTLASGKGGYSAISLWDVASGKERPPLTGHTMEVRSVAFSSDGTLASASQDHTVILWDAGGLKKRISLKGRYNDDYSVVFSPDGKTLATGTWKDGIELWDVTSGAVRASFKGGLRPLAFSPDGKTLASGSWEGTIKLLDMASGQECASFKVHIGGVQPLAFSPDGKTLALSNGGNIKLWNVASGQEHTGLYNAGGVFAFSPNGKTLASARRNNTIIIWDVASGQQRAFLKGHTKQVNSLAFSPDGKILASGSHDTTIKLWEVARGPELAFLQADETRALAFSPDGKTLASGSWDMVWREGIIQLWDTASGQQRAFLKGHTEQVSSLAFSPDGKTLASGSGDKTVKLWEVNSGKHLASLTGHTKAVLSVAFSPDGKTLATAGRSMNPELGKALELGKPTWEPGELKLWDVVNRQERTFPSWKRLAEDVFSVAFSPDGKTLATGTSDGIKLWGVARGPELAFLQADKTRALAFSPDGKTLASSWDTVLREGVIQLWDTASGQKRASLKVHTEQVSSLAFSPDGKTLASGGKDGIKLWDVTNGKVRAFLNGSGPLAFSPDGRLFASVSNNRTIMLWDLSQVP